MTTQVNQVDELALRVHLTKADIFRSIRRTTLGRPIIWLAPIPVAFAVYSGLASRPYGWAVALIVAAGFLLTLPYAIGAASAKQPGVLAPITYIFAEEGVTARFENGENKAAWSLVKGVMETDQYIYIKMQRGSFHLIPKRFITDDQAARLREVVRAHVVKNVRISN